jgi:uncharacterized protein (TIGR00299 family) protein
MFIGAMIDLGVNPKTIEKELGTLALDGYHIHVGRGEKSGIAGTKFNVHVVHEHEHSHEHTHLDGTTHSHPHSHSPTHGSHGGQLIEASKGQIEISVFEKNVPPRFRLYFLDAKGKPIAPPAAASLTLDTIRKNKHRQRFTFHDGGDHLEATTLLPEPHEFHAVLKLKRGARVEKLETDFVEDHHHHHHSDHDHAHQDDEHPHEHGRTFAEIRKLIRGSRLSEWVKENAEAVFHHIAVAEGKIHGHPPDEVHFHEVGAVDSIVDIVGACVALDLLGRPRVVAAPAVDGTGWINCAHGRFPLPAPATLEILGERGIAVTQCDEPHELITPTGAALLAHFATEFGPMRELVASKVGYGLGTRDNRTRPNVLRAVLGQSNPHSRSNANDWETDRIAVIETNLDDISPEILGHFVERALAEGALDVFYTPIQMKKNRPGVLLTVLCEDGSVDRFSELILAETTSLGVRRSIVERRKLKREFATVKTEFGEVTMKIGRLNGKTLHAMPEFESCKKLAAQAGVPVRKVFEAATALKVK